MVGEAPDQRAPILASKQLILSFFQGHRETGVTYICKQTSIKDTRSPRNSLWLCLGTISGYQFCQSYYLKFGSCSIFANFGYNMVIQVKQGVECLMSNASIPYFKCILIFQSKWRKKLKNKQGVVDHPNNKSDMGVRACNFTGVACVFAVSSIDSIHIRSEPARVRTCWGRNQVPDPYFACQRRTKAKKLKTAKKFQSWLRDQMRRNRQSLWPNYCHR